MNDIQSRSETAGQQGKAATSHSAKARAEHLASAPARFGPESGGGSGQPSLLAEPMRIQLGSPDTVDRPRWTAGESVGALVILAAIMGMLAALVWP